LASKEVKSNTKKEDEKKVKSKDIEKK